MEYHEHDLKRHIKVTIENREDGGANVSSDELSGLLLSGRNRMKILAAIEPAVRAILKHNGEDFGELVIDASFVTPTQS